MDPLMVLEHFLDPARAILTLVGILVWRGPWIIGVAGVVSAVACESALAAAQALHFWGEGIVPGTIASLLQAFLLYWLVQTVRVIGANKEQWRV